MEGSPSAIVLPRADASDDDFATWVKRHDAADRDTTVYEFTIQATPGKTVVISDLRIGHRNCGPVPVTATIVRDGRSPSAGSSIVIREVTANLDDRSGRVRPAPGTDKFPYRVSNIDPELFDLTVTSRTRDCHWRLLAE